MSYFTGTPTDMFESAVGSLGAYKGGLDGTKPCCTGCASGKKTCGGVSGLGEVAISTNVLGVAAMLGIAWLTFKSMKRVGR